MEIILDTDFYTPHAIDTMADQFTEYLSVTMLIKESVQLKLTVTAEYIIDSSEIINTFLNNTLLLSIQEKLYYEY